MVRLRGHDWAIYRYAAYTHTSRFLMEQSLSSRKLSRNERMEATFLRSSSSTFADLLSRALLLSAEPDKLLPPPSLPSSPRKGS